MKKALITGVTGQDGAYLAELLLQRGYEVYGSHRPACHVSTWRLEHLGLLGRPQFHLCECDITDIENCRSLINMVEPDEIYNLAAQSMVSESFKEPFVTAQISGVAVLNLLEVIRVDCPRVRFYQASSSELFGQAKEVPQSESTPFHPRSPYAVAKLFAHWATINYREAYGIFGACGILYNHESPLRSKEFVSRKITSTVARIATGSAEELVLGNLDVSRDWGYAKDYVDGMHKILQHAIADTFVLATNRTATVREFADLAFQIAGIELVWQGAGLEAHALESKSGRVLVRVDEKFYRPSEVGTMRGDSGKALRSLGWEAETSLERLCELMVEEDLRLERRPRSLLLNA